MRPESSGGSTGPITASCRVLCSALELKLRRIGQSTQQFLLRTAVKPNCVETKVASTNHQIQVSEFGKRRKRLILFTLFELQSWAENPRVGGSIPSLATIPNQALRDSWHRNCRHKRSCLPLVIEYVSHIRCFRVRPVVANLSLLSVQSWSLATTLKLSFDCSSLRNSNRTSAVCFFSRAAAQF